ncbi:hypothetical protein P4114_10255 [Pseudomonas aeruginosa]|nr:hypothetical protein [Pseudomonas aeruginosa]
MVHHQQRADVLFRHQAQGVEHHLVRSDGVHLLVLLGVQQLCHGFHTRPPEPFSRPARIVDGERIGKRGKRHRTD